MTIGAALLTGWLAGLFGSPHCAAMCGGIMGVLHGQIPHGQARLATGFHLGRLVSYGLLGLFVTALGMLPGQLLPAPWVPWTRVVLGLIIIMIALYVALPGRFRDVAGELAAPLTRQVLPQLGRLLPADRWDKAIGLGLLWGVLPCGLLYAVLAAAWLLASPVETLAMVTGFGLGTLPLLLGGGLGLLRVRGRIHTPLFRSAAASLLGLTGALIAAGPWLAQSVHHDALQFLMDCVVG
ncbi:MAG: sulfite exporter TauE/SafE family protein [Pseudomonadota bacterium]